MTYQEPEDIAFCRSPILYAVYDALYTSADFQYTCDVYLWYDGGSKPATPQYSLAKYPSPNGTQTFNVSHFAADFLKDKQYYFANENDTDEMYCFLSVDLNYQYGSTIGTPIVLDEIVVLDGYNYYLEGVNYLTTTNLGNAANSAVIERVVEDSGIVEGTACMSESILDLTGAGCFMTDRPTETTVPSDTSMRIFAYNDPSSIVYDIALRINGSDDYIIQYINSGYTKEIASIKAGTTEINTLALNVFGLTEVTQYEIYGRASDGTTITKVYTYTVAEPCKWGYKNLQFLNRYGVWDNLIVYGRKNESIEVERETYFRNILDVSTTPAMSYDTEKGQWGMHTSTGSKMLTVNTGWLDEEWYPIIEQLMLSEHIYDPDSEQAYVMVTDSLQKRTSLNDRLINYTFELKKANTLINTVQ